MVKRKWMSNKRIGKSVGECIFQNVVLHRNLENMKWLKENGCPICEYTKRNIKEKYEIDI